MRMVAASDARRSGGERGVCPSGGERGVCRSGGERRGRERGPDNRGLATPTSRSVQRGLVVLRWATLAWCVAVVVMSRERLERPWVAVVVLAAAAVVTVFTTVQAARGWAPTTASVLIELAVDVALIVGDGYAFVEGTARNGHQSLAGQFPIVGVVNAGFVLGVWFGLSAGAVVGFSNTISVWVNGFREFEGDDLASLGSSVCFFALWGGVAGWVGRLLTRAEHEVATTRAREEVAATLHDGVLQTLALVERRTEVSDPELAHLARDTDRDLRAFLWDRPARTDGRVDLATEVRDAALRAGRPFDLDVVLSIVDDDVVLAASDAAAFAGAVGEAVTNAGKHSGADTVVVFVDREDDDTVFVSVRDDGRGFDPSVPAADQPGRGIVGSIEARMDAAGGRTEIVSEPDGGTDVRLWLP